MRLKDSLIKKHYERKHGKDAYYGQLLKILTDIMKHYKMINLKQFEVWFITGSQHLYGEETLKKVAEHSKEIADFLNASKKYALA